VSQSGSPSPARPGPMENEYKSFRRYRCQKPFSASVDRVETTGKKIPGHGYMVGEVCQTENPLFFQPRRDCKDSRRYNK
jgi:hypothetical protein